jgi:hypothetical protein
MFQYDNSEILFVVILFGVMVILIFVLTPDSSNEYFVDKADDWDLNTDLLQTDYNDNPKTLTKVLLSSVKYMSVKDFNTMINTIRDIIYRDILNYSKTCADMNGDDGPQPNQMTLFCINDVQAMHEEIIDHIAEYIITTIKTKYDINLNPYQVTGDFMVHLNLLEDVLYPLIYSGLYTVHGLQYFDKTILKQKVQYNLLTRDVLYTTLLRRGLDVLPDADEHP